MKETIINILVNKRYTKLSPAEVAQYFGKLAPSDQALVTAEILKNNNLLAKDKIMEYMRNELKQSFDQYYISGTIPTSIVEELIS